MRKETKEMNVVDPEELWKTISTIFTKEMIEKAINFVKEEEERVENGTILPLNNLVGGKQGKGTNRSMLSSSRSPRGNRGGNITPLDSIKRKK